MSSSLPQAVLVLSILLQMTAAFLALRLVRGEEQRWSWWLLAGALLIMAVRRLLTLVESLLWPGQFTLNLPPELVALAISVIMVLAVWGMAPFLAAQRRRSRLYRRIVEASWEGILILDETGRTTFVNQRLADLVGLPRRSLLGRPLADLVTPETRETTTTLLAKRAGGAGTVDLTFSSQRRGVVCTLASHAPLLDEQERYTGALLMVTDINDRRRMEDALRHSEQFVRSTMDALAQRVAILDDQGTIRAVNRRWREQRPHCPLPTEPREDQNYLELLDREGAAGQEKAGACAEGIRAVLAGTLNQFALEYSLETEEGRRWFLGRVNPFTSNDRRFVVLTHEDITPLKEAESFVTELAYHDTLTGLPNRLLLQDRLSQHLIQAGRDRELVAVLFLDLDHFKYINDTLGHGAGDRMLKTVAGRLLSCVRKSDTVARLGGDEFLVILTGLDSPGDASVIARKMLEALTAPVDLEGQEVFTSSSIGIALFPEDGADAESLIGNADLAMYLAKEEGRNTYRYFSRELNARARRRMDLEAELRTALAAGQFILHYQDQVTAGEGRLSGVEALVRWQHPGRGVLLPEEFLAVAEESGLILPLGHWVLQTACQQFRRWREEGLAVPRLAINLSARQLLDPDLPQQLEKVLADNGLAPACLELEITEAAVHQAPEQASANLQRLRAAGVNLAIDDFGTGFSSLLLLRQLPVKRLKVAHNFIHQLAFGEEGPAMVRTIIGMAHTLGFSVIAEGVETEEQRSFLAAHGCEEVQGFLLGRPVPAGELAGTLRRRQPQKSE